MKKICALLVLMAIYPVAAQAQRGFVAASTLPDLSGLATAGDGRFLAVHDAKTPTNSSAQGSVCSSRLGTLKVFCIRR